MTTDAISFRGIPEWLVRLRAQAGGGPAQPPAPTAPSPPPDAQAAQLDALKAELGRLRVDMEASVKAQADVDARERAELVAMIVDQKDQIEQLLTTVRRLEDTLQASREYATELATKLAESIQARIADVARLQGQLDASEAGRRLQGERLGILEAQTREIPGLRDQLMKAQIALELYRAYAARLQQQLTAAGVDPLPLPDIPQSALDAATAAGGDR